MDRKVIGTLVGVAGVLLWFMPMAYIDFMGTVGYQAGNHIGGIAYLLLISSAAYAALSWREQHSLRIIAASVAAGIAVLFLLQIGGSAAWGLYGLIAFSVAGIWLAVIDNKKAQAA